MTIRARNKDKKIKQKKSSRIGKFFGIFSLVLLTLFLAACVTAGLFVNSWLKNLPDYKSAGAFQVAEPTKIYSSDGQLLAKLYLQNREVVSIEDISPDVLHGVVAVEDERFYQHGALDYMGIIRALIETARGNRQGASTITQQYVRSTVLVDESVDMTLARKVREAYIAIQIEKIVPKDRILTNYLNAVYFGEGAYGIEAASQTYFSKNAKDLTLSEAALIVGLIQSPNRLDPYLNPEGALQRRRHVLDRMLVNKYITQQQYNEAVNQALKLEKTDEPTDGIYSNPYYVSWVKKQLQQQFPKSKVFSGGLTVYTTLDTQLQKYADKAVKDYSKKGKPSVALVSIDPRTGHVKALVGGKDYSKSKFNLAVQGKRQPGSSFKTFVLAAAIEEGMSPQFRIDSNSPVAIPSDPVWNVSNSEGGGKGMISLASATYNSVNTVYARVAWEIGIKKVTDMAKRLGITTPLPNYPSIALGSVNCTPLEMASAYGTLANRGIHHSPVFVTKVTDKSGNVLFESKETETRAIDNSVAYAVTHTLEGVVKWGTGTRADIGRPVAGKTGTSQNNRDAWFVGYTPQLVTSVWVGYPKEKTIIVNGARGFGGTLAAPIWAEYMKDALHDQPVLDFTPAAAPKYRGGSFHPLVSSKTKKQLADKNTIKVYIYSSEPKGTVINTETDPETGAVTITISKGPEPGTETPPDSGGGSTTPTDTPPPPPPSGEETGTSTP